MRKFNRETFLMKCWTKQWWNTAPTDIQAETARGYLTDPVIKLFTAFHALYDESTRKFHRKKFADDGRTTYWMKQPWNTTVTAPAKKLLQEKRTANTVTLELIYTLPAVPHMMIRCGHSTARHFWQRTDELLDETTTKYCTDRQIQRKQLAATAPTSKLIYALHVVPHTTIRCRNSTGTHFLTTDGQPAGRNDDKIRHHPINSTETARLYRTDLGINLYTACRAPRWLDRNIQPRDIFWWWTDELLDETTTKRNTAPADKFNRNSLLLLHRPGN